MSGWVKLDDDFFLNPKVQAAGPEAAYMWIVSIAWSAGRGLDGLIPTHMVPVIAALAGVANSELAIGRLLDVGLWDPPDPDGPPGYRVHDFLEKQTPAAEREAAKEGARERQRRSRAKKAGQNPPSAREVSSNGHGDVTRDVTRESQRSSFAEVEVEKEIENPLPPRTLRSVAAHPAGSGGTPPAPRRLNPRALGTNPRAQAQAERTARAATCQQCGGPRHPIGPCPTLLAEADR